MIDPYSFSAAVEKAVKAEIANKANHLITNKVNWEHPERDYGWRCGQIDGLKEALAIIANLQRQDGGKQ